VLQGEKEGIFLIVGKWPGQRAFFHVTAFGWFAGGKGVGGIEEGIACNEVNGPVELRGAGLRGDFNASASRSRETSGIRILVDLDVLNRRGRNTRPVGLQAVNYERDATGRNRVVAKEARDKGDVVLVEDRNTVQSIAIDVVRASIFGDICGHLGRIVWADVDCLTQRRDRKGDAKRRNGFRTEDHFRGGVFESTGADGQLVSARGEISKPESPV
jgi:hypothetical protein